MSFTEKFTRFLFHCFHRFSVVASRFIADREYTNTWNIAIANNHIAHTVNTSWNKVWEVSQRRTLTEVVCFVVCFVENKQTESRTEHIETRILWIVRVSYSIHICLFHQQNIFFHPVKAHRFCFVWRPIVVVCALYEKSFLIENNLALFFINF